MDLEPRKIQIVPVHYPSADATKPGWQVDIHDGSKPTVQRTITDSFRAEDHVDCRWYLETHVPQDPFDKGRADRTVVQLNKYARMLAHQLKITLQSADIIELVIHDDHLVDHDPRMTIHRLHWELLENPWAWGLTTLKLRVRRCISSPRIGQPFLSTLLRAPAQQINILHVVARKRRTTINQPTDISPFMTLGILIQIRAELQRQRWPLILNITTIRPGTLQALTDHFVELRTRYRSNPYHIIHLDLHGEADERGVAKLYFENSGSTVACESTEVAEVLSGFPVPFVVLNACRSGRADLGPTRNTAAILSAAGCAENILAMSFNALSVSAEIFLRAFYTAFLLRGATFGCAAHSGRGALKANKSRRGRFEQCLPLLDWFVPVIYSAVEDLAVALPVDLARHEMKWDLGLVGRDYDVATLEKVLLKRRKAFLFGHAWIGKSSFLRYARHIWEGTAFADEVLHVDLTTSSPLQSSCALVGALQSQGSRGNGRPMDENALLQHLKEESRVLVIIDGLHTAFPSCSFPGNSPSSPLEGQSIALPELRLLLQKLVKACVESSKGSMIVLAGRPLSPDSTPCNLGSWIHQTFKKSHAVMQLKGLSLTDSLSLCEQAIRKSGQHLPDTAAPGTRDKLELLGRLLLGIPGAISWVIPLAQEAKVSWESIRTHLLEDGPATCAALALQTTAFDHISKEFRALSTELLPEQFGVLLMIGLFWHQGPYNGRFTEAMLEFGICSNEEVVKLALRFASNRGYIQLAALHRSKRISFIHPLFSIYCRITLRGLDRRSRITGISPTGGEAPDSTPEYPSSSEPSKLSAGPFLPPLALYAAITTPIEVPVIIHGHLKVLTWFLENVDYQLAFQLACPDDATDNLTPFRIQPDPKAHHFLNTLTCLRICVDNAKYLRPEQSWPLDHFFKIAPLVMSAATAVEASVFADHFERLLAELGSDEDLVQSSLYIQVFFIITAINVGFLRQVHANNSSGRWREFAKHARRLCQSIYMPMLFHKIVTGCLDALISDPQDGFEHIAELLPAAIQAAETPVLDDTPPSDTIALGLSQSTEETRIARQRITTTPSILDQRVDPSFLQDARDAARALDTRPLTGAAEGSDNDQPKHEGPGKAESVIMDFLARRLKKTSEGGRSWAQLFTPRLLTSVIGAPGSANVMEDQLGAAETAMNRADWDFSQNLHYTLFQSHFKNGDMRQANEHLRQVIASMSGKPERRALVEHFERFLRLMELHDICLGISAADTDTLDDASSVGPALQEMECLVQDLPDPELREMMLRSVASTRAAAQLKPSSRPDAEGWKGIRNDLQKLNISVTGKENMEKVLHGSSTAGRLFRAVKEQADEGKTREALASLNELEKLCKKEPAAMFVVAGGQETIDWLRAAIQEQLKAEEDWEQAVREDAELHQKARDAKDRERAARESGEQLAAYERRLRGHMLEALWTVLAVAGCLLLSSVVDWIWPS